MKDKSIQPQKFLFYDQNKFIFYLLRNVLQILINELSLK